MSTAVPEPAPAFTLTGVGKRLGSRTVLADISLRISSGGIHGLVGPNGSGKTTLLRLLAGIAAPDRGRIERNHGALEQIGYVPQRFGLYDELTVRENLRFQSQMRVVAMSAEEAERQFGLEALSACRAVNLSGGQRQRLLIAAALLHRPTLLLFDEPTTALDAAARRDLWDLLRREADRGTTIVLTTHEEADAQQCTTATRLQDGRIVDAGRPPGGAG